MDSLQEKPKVFIAPGSHIVGDVTFGTDCSVWYNAVIRGDTETITVGSRTNIQDNCVLHIDSGSPMKIGSDVTVGHGSILHGCSIGDNTVIGMGSIILNGAKIGNNCMIGAGTLVAQGKEIPDGMLAFGNPVRIIRPMTEKEIEGNKISSEHYVNEARASLKAEEQ